MLRDKSDNTKSNESPGGMLKGPRKSWVRPHISHASISEVTKAQKAALRTDTGGNTPSHKS